MPQPRTGKIYKCLICEKEVYKKPSTVYKNVFCSRECWYQQHNKNPNKKAYKEKIFISGYFYLYMPNHPNAIKKGRYIAEHRYNLEQKLGRLLNHNEVAHHINENKKDNRFENLEVLTRAEHNRKHANKRKRKPDGSF